MDETPNSRDLVTVVLDNCHKISARAAHIMAGIDDFISRNEKELSPENIEDMKVIKSSCGTLTDRIEGVLVSGKLQEVNSNQAEFAAYLTKIRHDLHNTINIIMGYTELLMLDFNNRGLAKYQETWSALMNEMKQIIEMSNELKAPEPPGGNEVIPMAELPEDEDLAIEGYEEFKKRVSILVVDDMSENRQILERYLRRIGFTRISLAEDGLAAMNMLKKHKFDIVLLDIEMPKMTGKELLPYIKEDMAKGNIMAIMISGYEGDEAVVECIALGAEDLITKPFNPELLRVRINSCVQRKWYRYKENIYRQRIDMVKKNLIRGYNLASILYTLWKI